MDKKRRAFLKGAAQKLEPTVHVGKDGVTDKVVEEVVRQLKQKRLVKVRLLPSMEEDRHEAAERLAAKASAVLIEVRGRTAVLAQD
ncbi:MAG: YhbY family RNA-binding protein [Thermoplasmata archaeon]